MQRDFWRLIATGITTVEVAGEIGLVPPAEFEANHWAAPATEHYREHPVLTEVGSN